MEDIKNANIIFGKYVGFLNSKAVRKAPKPVVNDYVHVPPESMDIHKDVTIATDIMFVNKLPILTSISKNLKFITSQKLGSRATKNILKAIRNVIKLYSQHDFKVIAANIDNKVECLRDKLNPQNQVIKERAQVLKTTLPFNKIPTTMIIEMIYFVIVWLPAFPPKAGISTTLSPHADYKKHCKVPFGVYV
eukprot:15353227-Ditylum_brightwellii.AAC.1